MLTKLLLTLAVIAIAWLVVTNQTRREALVRRPVMRPAGASSVATNPTVIRLLAYGLLLSMVLGSGFLLYQHWRDEYQVVTVKVINTRTGQAVAYAARRGDVADRQFETLDGRVVHVAEIERIEVGRRRAVH